MTCLFAIAVFVFAAHWVLNDLILAKAINTVADVASTTLADVLEFSLAQYDSHYRNLRKAAAAAAGKGTG